jgi:hypothetical protein
MGRHSDQPTVYGVLAAYGTRVGGGGGGGGEGGGEGKGGGLAAVNVHLHGIEGGHVCAASLDTPALKKTMGRVKKTVEGIRNERFDPTPNGFGCRWCGYRHVCKESAWKV